MGVFAQIATGQQGGVFKRVANATPPQGEMQNGRVVNGGSPSLGNFISNTAKGVAQGADFLLKQPARFAVSAAVAPVDIARQTYGLATDKPVQPIAKKFPYVGETFQSEAAKGQQDIVSGKAPLASALKPFVEVPLAGVQTATLPGASRLFKTGTDKAIAKGSSILSNRAEKKASTFALDLTAPKLSTAEKAQAIARGNSTSPGIFKPSKILPTQRDHQIAESVADVVSSKNTIVENVDAIDQRLSHINQGVKALIAERKVPFNENQLRSRLNAAAKDNNLVFASDATAKRTYDALVNEFMNHVKGKDTLGLFEARQSFDHVPAIKKLLDSAPAGENVRKQLVLTVREAANQYIADLLPKNNPYRPMMKIETRMIEALGNIGDTNASSIGANKLQLLLKKYPALAWFVGGIATAAILGSGGVGVGRALIGSSD